MVKRVLMIAYHYPPLSGGSGIHRTHAFARHLPEHGWQPLVLTVHPRAYEDLGANHHDAAIAVHRSFALDSSRHLALRGRYPELLAQPDRWISWWLGAVPAGLRLIRKHRPDAIWSSYPIATAHLIALSLHRLTGVPWIADQRDPMVDAGYPPDPRRRRIHGWIERQSIRHAAAVVCTTPGALLSLGQRHPLADERRLALIPNGYDESVFACAELTDRPAGSKPFTLLHSGVIYPSERDPGPLFAALAKLLSEHRIGPDNFRLLLRASAHDGHLRMLMQRHPGLDKIIELAPALPYHQAVAEMLGADGLLLLQAANCNSQIPAKLYEYLRARRPLLALTDAAGDTAATLRAAGIDTIGQPDSAADIAAALLRFLHLCRTWQAPLASQKIITSHSRAARTLELATLLDRTVHKEAT
ncbi:glycosyltransferase [Duganella vulcania]|uniref:Glycosyltransferase n=1 Tax=Duganella vulcania TaxID=2692166 RepID=A0A845GSM7_9BURK|nr:glycosyltransferase [Duganella vulcania]MYM97503.1 glycosyltransferase [Duganella vulcania]